MSEREGVPSQYIIVTPSPCSTDAKVLLDDVPTGAANTKLFVTKGITDVSIDKPGAELKEVDIKGTTSKKPLEITITWVKPG